MENTSQNKSQLDTALSAATLDRLSNKLLEKTYTKTQAIRRVRFIREILGMKIFKSGSGTFEELINSYIQEKPEALKDKRWLLSLGDNFFNLFDKKTVNVLLKNLDEVVNTMKVVSIYLPFPLYEFSSDLGGSVTDEHFTKIGEWFKKNQGHSALFELNFAADLIGGCALSVNGNYRDYSLKGKLNASRETILSNLRSYKKT